jgi:hypothetical protein
MENELGLSQSVHFNSHKNSKVILNPEDEEEQAELDFMKD